VIFLKPSGGQSLDRCGLGVRLTLQLAGSGGDSLEIERADAALIQHFNADGLDQQACRLGDGDRCVLAPPSVRWPRLAVSVNALI
jgi:hypothetical protein